MKLKKLTHMWLFKVLICFLATVYLADAANVDDLMSDNNVVHYDVLFVQTTHPAQTLTCINNHSIHSYSKIKFSHKLYSTIYDEDSPLIRDDRGTPQESEFYPFIAQNDNILYITSDVRTFLFIFHCSLLN